MIRISLLLAGVVGPLIYVAFALGGQWLAPGYDPAVRMVSELGLSDMPAATLFNTGLMVSGALTVLAALGLGLDAARRGAALSGALAGLAVAVFGASIVVGGLFPLPDERHLAWGAGFAVQIATVYGAMVGTMLGTAGFFLLAAAGLALLAFVIIRVERRIAKPVAAGGEA